MNKQTLLFVMNPKTPDTEISKAAEAAAEHQTRLICLILTPAPVVPMSAYGGLPYSGVSLPDDWSERMGEARENLQERVQEIESLLAKSGASGDVQSAICATVDIKHVVSQFARVSDSAFIAGNLREDHGMLREVAAGILFHAPIGFRINGAAFHKTDRVLVAWDSSASAASAVHAALPYLLGASEIMIACVDPVATADRDGQDPGTDLAAWLSHHGCNVTVAQFPSGGGDVADCLQKRASEFGADLVIMGAYGHARMIQTVFGGTTRSMIDQTDLPVFLAH